MLNDILLDNLGQHVSSAIPLTRIAIFQVLISLHLYNPQLVLAEQEKRGVAQQVFGQWTKDYDKMEIFLPQ